MSDSDTVDFDEVVDVLCVGTGPGVLAYALCCAANDLDVLIVEPGELDPQTTEYIAAMTEDLAGCPPDVDLVSSRVQPVPPSSGRHATVETFVGEDLRRWSAVCLASPFGVMFTQVADLLTPMRTDGGELLTAAVVGRYRCETDRPGPGLDTWLRAQAAGHGFASDARLTGLVVEANRVAGAKLETDTGPRLVGATAGVAISVGCAPPEWPVQRELGGAVAEVAVVGRRAGRFARVELFLAADR